MPCKITKSPRRDRKFYDFKVIPKDRRRKPFLVEVKMDFYYKKSKNLAIELSDNKGKPSGISITKADYVVYACSDGVFEFKTDELKKFLKANKFFKVVKGGDNRAFTMCLVKGSVLFKQKFCRKIGDGVIKRKNGSLGGKR